MEDYFDWTFSLSSRADLPWALVRHLKDKCDSVGRPLSCLMQMHWVEANEVTKVHFLIRANYPSHTLRNELIALGEHALDELFALHPWTASSVVEGLRTFDGKKKTMEIHATCKPVSHQTWVANMVEKTGFQEKSLIFAARFAMEVIDRPQDFRTALPVFVTTQLGSTVRAGMRGLVYGAASNGEVAEELGRKARQLVEAGLVPVEASGLGDSEIDMVRLISRYVSDSGVEDEALGIMCVLRAIGNAVGLRTEEVDYLIELGLLAKNVNTEASHVSA